MSKVDLEHFRDVVKRIALDGDQGFARDLTRVADELMELRKDVLAAQAVVEACEGFLNANSLREFCVHMGDIREALAAYRAKVGGTGK